MDSLLALWAAFSAVAAAEAIAVFLGSLLAAALAMLLFHRIVLRFTASTGRTPTSSRWRAA